MEEVTLASALESVQKWDAEERETFIGSAAPWTLTGNLVGTGGAPNSVQQVLDWLGNEISERSYQLAAALQAVGIKLGVVLTHNPCF